MKLKEGDKVIVISGSRKDKKKTGTILKTFSDSDKVLVEGVNLKKKVTRGAQGEKTQIEVEYPIHVSNVMFYDEKSKQGTRVGIEGKGKEKKRVTKKSSTNID
jgi:large subunit ribosomal protein L24